MKNWQNNFYLQRIGLKIDGYRSRSASGGLAESGRVDWEMPSHMIPAVLPPLEMRSWNVRLENTGERTWVCQGDGAFFLTYCLTDGGRLRGFECLARNASIMKAVFERSGRFFSPPALAGP